MYAKATTTLLASAAILLSACGGKSDEDQIRGIVEDGAKKPSTICDNLAAAPLKTIGGKDGCKKLADQQKATDASVESVSVNGDKGSAKVKDKDGSNDVKFVKEGGDWKIAVDG